MIRRAQRADRRPVRADRPDRPTSGLSPITLLIGAVLLALAAVALVGLAVVVATNARAHEAPSGWAYPSECCHEVHCRVLPHSRVVPTSDGYYIAELQVVVPYSEANVSPDHHYHYCTTSVYEHGKVVAKQLQYATSPHPTLNRSLLCFYAPEGAV